MEGNNNFNNTNTNSKARNPSTSSAGVSTNGNQHARSDSDYALGLDMDYQKAVFDELAKIKRTEREVKACSEDLIKYYDSFKQYIDPSGPNPTNRSRFVFRGGSNHKCSRLCNASHITGDMYICDVSGAIHFCRSECCRYTRPDPDTNQYICFLSSKTYGSLMSRRPPREKQEYKKPPKGSSMSKNKESMPMLGMLSGKGAYSTNDSGDGCDDGEEKTKKRRKRASKRSSASNAKNTTKESSSKSLSIYCNSNEEYDMGSGSEMEGDGEDGDDETYMEELEEFNNAMDASDHNDFMEESEFCLGSDAMGYSDAIDNVDDYEDDDNEIDADPEYWDRQAREIEEDIQKTNEHVYNLHTSLDGVVTRRLNKEEESERRSIEEGRDIRPEMTIRAFIKNKKVRDCILQGYIKFLAIEEKEKQKFIKQQEEDMAIRATLARKAAERESVVFEDENDGETSDDSGTETVYSEIRNLGISGNNRNALVASLPPIRTQGLVPVGPAPVKLERISKMTAMGLPTSAREILSGAQKGYTPLCKHLFLLYPYRESVWFILENIFAIYKYESEAISSMSGNVGNGRTFGDMERSELNGIPQIRRIKSEFFDGGDRRMSLLDDRMMMLKDMDASSMGAGSPSSKEVDETELYVNNKKRKMDIRSRYTFSEYERITGSDRRQNAAAAYRIFLNERRNSNSNNLRRYSTGNIIFDRSKHRSDIYSPTYSPASSFSSYSPQSFSGDNGYGGFSSPPQTPSPSSARSSSSFASSFSFTSYEPPQSDGRFTASNNSNYNSMGESPRNYAQSHHYYPPSFANHVKQEQQQPQPPADKGLGFVSTATRMSNEITRNELFRVCKEIVHTLFFSEQRVNLMTAKRNAVIEETKTELRNHGSRRSRKGTKPTRMAMKEIVEERHHLLKQYVTPRYDPEEEYKITCGICNYWITTMESPWAKKSKVRVKPEHFAIAFLYMCKQGDKLNGEEIIPVRPMIRDYLIDQSILDEFTIGKKTYLKSIITPGKDIIKSVIESYDGVVDIEKIKPRFDYFRLD